MKLRQLNSVDQLRDAAPAWDELWRCSGVAIPTARAELVAQWIERFAADARICVPVVEQDGRMVAAWPLVGRRLRGLLPVGGLTGNVWSPNGELLLDPTTDVEAVVDLLVDALGAVRWPLVWLEMVPLDEPHWQALTTALARRHVAFDVHYRWRIGQVETLGDFETYLAGRSKHLRRSLRKDLQRLEKDGPVEFKAHERFTPEEVHDRLRRVFELENRGWKGEAGSSVLRTPGMFDFYCRQARQLAQWGQLRVFELEHRGEPIAFELGWTAKGVYHSYKVGYEPAYRGFGPGHLLRMQLIRFLFDRADHRLVDFQGPQTEALSAWSTRSYPIARLIIAPQRISSRTLLAGYRALVPLVRRIRRRKTGTLATGQ